MKSLGRNDTTRKQFIKTVASVVGNDYSNPSIAFYKKQYIGKKHGTVDGWQSYSKFIDNNGQQLGDELIRQKAVSVKRDPRLKQDSQLRFPHDSLFFQVEEGGSTMNVGREGSEMTSTAAASEEATVAYGDLMSQFMSAMTENDPPPSPDAERREIDESEQPADPVKLKAAMKAAAAAHRAWDTKGTEYDSILRKSKKSDSTSGTKHEKELEEVTKKGKESDRELGDLMVTVRSKNEEDVTMIELKSIEAHMETLAKMIKDGNTKVGLLKRWL